MHIRVGPVNVRAVGSDIESLPSGRSGRGQPGDLSEPHLELSERTVHYHQPVTQHYGVGDQLVLRPHPPCPDYTESKGEVRVDVQVLQHAQSR